MPKAKGSIKIISGGQTGVDRAALDAAMGLGVDVGGWCPDNRMAEDGIIAEIYPLQPLESGGYRQRTRKNVQDSDGTLIIYFGEPTGGTALTITFCERLSKPCLLIDAEKVNLYEAADQLAGFVADRGIEVLNVAGPRASGEPGAYNYTKALLELFIKDFHGQSQ